MEFKWIEFDLSVYPKDTPIEEINADAERALEQLEGSAQDTLALNDATEYEIQTRKLSL